MKLAVSNIAWPHEMDREVAEILNRLNVRGIEVAPTKVWPALLEATSSQIHSYRQRWAEWGIEIVASQALLFGHPELTIFENAETRRRTIAYLDNVISVCTQLGARALVFGSPKNRRTHGLPPDEVQRIAVEFFSALGRAAHRAGAAIVLEANPAEYGADFVTDAVQALALVRAVDHAGFRLHLDTGCMTLSNDPVEAIVAEGAELLAHFHISEPFLAPIGRGNVNHARFAKALQTSPYTGWVSAEMNQPDPFGLPEFETAIRAALSSYDAAPASQ
jgi:sugar phosphate isomerase/epimerase